MAEYKREDVPKLLGAIKKGKILPLYLIVGERYLGRQIADELVRQLIPDEKLLKQNLHLVDGERESPLETLNLLKTFSLFPGRRVVKVSDSRLFQTQSVLKPLWGRAQRAALGGDFKLAGLCLRKFISTGGLSGQNGEELTRLADEEWKKLFGFVKPQEKMAWVEKALASCTDDEMVGAVGDEKDNAQLYMDAFSAGIPEENILVLLVEEVDKRKKIYKFIKEIGAVLDVSVASGAATAAKKDQEGVLRELISKTLADFSKRIEPKALACLLERVGFHPVAVVRETEKLALYAGDRDVISLDDVEEIIGRTREDALYELTEAFSQKNLEKALLLTARILESGTHPLVLISGLRNHLRKQAVICSLRGQAYPVYVEGMTFAAFQKGYLPQLREEKGELLKKLPSHPYALYMMFEKAKKHTSGWLMKGQKQLLEAEMRMKSSSLPGQLVFENFLFEMLVNPSRN